MCFSNMYDGTLQPGCVPQEHERVAADAIGKAERVQGIVVRDLMDY